MLHRYIIRTRVLHSKTRSFVAISLKAIHHDKYCNWPSLGKGRRETITNIISTLSIQISIDVTARSCTKPSVHQSWKYNLCTWGTIIVTVLAGFVDRLPVVRLPIAITYLAISDLQWAFYLFLRSTEELFFQKPFSTFPMRHGVRPNIMYAW